MNTALNISDRLKKILFMLLMCSVVLLSWSHRDPIFFRDYAIIWEGIGRMLAGHSPFSDIGMPIGPIVLYIPYIFAKFIGFTWFNLQLSQLFQSLLLIMIGSAIVNRLTSSLGVYLFAVGLYSLFFVSFLMHPWYNITALLLLLCSIYFSLFKNLGALCIAGIFAGLCIFCKQDYGYMAILSCLISILGRELIEIPDRSHLINRHTFLIVIKNLGVLFLGVITVFAGFILLYKDGYIDYWFGMAIKSENANMKITALISAYRNGLMYLAVVGLILSLKFRSYTLLICSAMLLVSAVTRYTSGMYFTSFFFWLFLPPYLYEIRHSVLINLQRGIKLFILLIIGVALTLALKTPLVTVYNFWMSTLTNKAEHYYLDASKVVLPVINLGACIPMLANVYAPGKICNSLQEINKSLDKVSNPLVLNISEFTPLTELVSGEYPSNHPLWYHIGITLHEREINRILADVGMGLYDLIAVQHVLTEPTLFDLNLLKKLRGTSKYIELTPMISPMSATDYCENSKVCGGEIYIFIKR